MTPILETKNLTHTYGEGTPFRSDALQSVNLSIAQGEFVGIIGHTGSGKSTLIQHLNGLLKPTSGQVLLGGRDIWSDKKIYPGDPLPRGPGVPVSGVPAL